MNAYIPLRLLIILFISLPLALSAQDKAGKASSKLAVVWSSGDPEVAEKVCFMYTHGAKRNGWFNEVRLIVWGPSAQLITQNKKLQDLMHAMAKDGVKLEACRACANMYGVADQLTALGIEVKGMGRELSNYLKNDWEVITF